MHSEEQKHFSLVKGNAIMKPMHCFQLKVLNLKSKRTNKAWRDKETIET